MTPKRLVSWLLDRWDARFGADGFLEGWCPGAKFEAAAHGPLACILHVRDANDLHHLTDEAVALAYEAACDGLIVWAARARQHSRRTGQ